MISEYCGLATFYASHIEEIVKEVALENQDFVSLKATPLDQNSNLYLKDPIYKSDPGLPMHADIIYKIAPEKGDVQTALRMIARKILVKASYFNDSKPKESNWHDEKLYANS